MYPHTKKLTRGQKTRRAISTLVVAGIGVFGIKYAVTINNYLKPFENTSGKKNVVLISPHKTADPDSFLQKRAKKFKKILCKREPFREMKSPFDTTKANYFCHTIKVPAEALKPNNSMLSFDRIIKWQIDSVLTAVAKKHGSIDLGMLLNHSSPDTSALAKVYQQTIIKETPTKTPGVTICQTRCQKKTATISNEDIEFIARINPYSQKIFNNNSNFIYYGCSAGREADLDSLGSAKGSSIARQLSESYGVTVEAPRHIYMGSIIRDGEKIFLTSSKHPKYLEHIPISDGDVIKDEAFSIKGPDNREYVVICKREILDKTTNIVHACSDINRIVSLRNQMTMDEDEKRISELYDHGINKFDINKLEELGYTNYKEHPGHTYFMDTRTFYRPSKFKRICNKVALDIERFTEIKKAEYGILKTKLLLQYYKLIDKY